MQAHSGADHCNSAYVKYLDCLTVKNYMLLLNFFLCGIIEMDHRTVIKFNASLRMFEGSLNIETKKHDSNRM